MKAMVIVHGKEGGRLQLRDVSRPEPGPDDLLMRVKATTVNRADLYQLQGTYDPTKKPVEGIAGLEAAGEVAGMGKNVSGFSMGDRIMGLCGGGYAEYTTLDYRLALPVPGGLSWEEAATIPLGYMTEYNAMIMNACLQPGEAVLVHAAAAGVGVTAIQIAKFYGAKPVMGTDSPETKLKVLQDLGLDLGIDYRRKNFADAVLDATEGKGADVIIDHVGGPYLKDNLRSMAVKGRLVSVGRLGGTTGELDLELMAFKRLQLIGVTFRTRTMEEKIAIAQGVVDNLLPPIADGRLKPVIDRIFSLDQAPEAQAYMGSNAQIGKIVLKV
jgi:NADPH2:quinone reductase